MTQSLTGFHLRFLGVLLLALAAIGYANYQLFNYSAAAAAQRQAALLAREVGARVDGHLRSQLLLMQNLALALDAPSALKTRPAERERLEAELVSLLPGAEAAHLLPADKSGVPVATGGVPAPVIEQVRKHVNDAAGKPRLVHDNKTMVAYTLVTPLGKSGQPPAGYLTVRFALAPLQSLLTRAASGAGYLELADDAADTSLALAGDASLREHSAPISTTIGERGWTLFLWPSLTAPRGITGISDLPLHHLALVAAALVLVLLAGVRLWRRSVRSVRHDVMSLLRMFKDVRNGNMRVDYPLRLKDFSDAYQFLRTSGRKMLREKKRLKNMGLIDHLSQLSNRRHFEMRLKELFELSKTHGPSAVLIIDVDHFKRVNDQHGHDAGDALITGFAAALRRCVRQTDMLARLGGDEFCVIYPYTTLERAEIYAERLRRQLPREVPLLKGVVHELRWTGGLSCMNEKDSKFDDVLWRADQALIQAKEAGRNVLRVFDPAKGLNKKAPMAAS